MRDFLTAITKKIRNINTPFFYPWAWAVIILALLLISYSVGIGFYLWCAITLNLL